MPNIFNMSAGLAPGNSSSTGNSKFYMFAGLVPGVDSGNTVSLQSSLAASAGFSVAVKSRVELNYSVASGLALSSTENAVVSVISFLQSGYVVSGLVSASESLTINSRASHDGHSSRNSIGNLFSAALLAHHQSALRSAVANISNTSLSGDEPRSAILSGVDFSDLSTGNAVVDYFASASDAIISGVSAGESWVEQLSGLSALLSQTENVDSYAVGGNVVGSVLGQSETEAGMTGDAATAASLSSAQIGGSAFDAGSVLAAVLSAGSQSSIDFINAVSALAALTGAASMQHVFLMVVNSLADVGASSASSDVFLSVNSTNIITSALLETVGADSVLAASAVSVAAINAGALASSRFNYLRETGFVVIGAITIQAAVLAKMSVTPSVEIQSVKIN